MTTNRLQIRRLQAQYLVASEHPSPASVKNRLDEGLSRNLTEALSAAFSSWFSENDESVWLIRQMKIEVVVNVAWERDKFTRVMTMQIGRVLGAILQGGEDSGNVMRFPNRAAYLARFLADLADGLAWGRWYYESFEGLHLLPTSAALRTAVCDKPDTGHKALLQLADGELKKVLRALTPQDARRIVESLTENETEGDEFRCCRAAWTAWQAIEADLYDSPDEWHQTLHLYVAASREQSGVSGLTLKKGTRALLRLAHRLRRDSTAQAEQLLSALFSGETATLFAAAGAGEAETLLPLLRCPPVWVREVAQTLLARETGQKTVETETTAARRDTSCGGAFLLLPLIDELPLTEATRDWPHADEAAAISLVRFLLLTKCCGHRRAERAFYDSLLRDLLLIPPAISTATLDEWQAGVTREHLQSFLETLGSWHRSYGAVRDEKLILAASRLRGRPVVTLIDAARGLWLTVNRYSTRRPQRLIEELRNSLSELERNDGLLLCDSSLLATLWAEFPNVKMLSLEDEAAQTKSEEENKTANVLARLDKLPDELSYLALPDSFRLARSLDLALSVAAQHVMRAFAWRLPGFAESNLPYLAGNFLDFAGSLEEEAARRVVRLGRPPLHLVLGLTGMMRQTYRLSWLDERPLMLFQET